MRPIFLVLPFTLLLAPLTARAEPDPRTAPLAQERPLYLDTQAPIDERVADLVSRLTLEEKAQALNHNGKDLTRIGLRGDKWNQCLNGVQWSEPTTLFPICTGLAATWNPEFIQNEVARVLSDEARGIYNGWRRDPNAPGQHKGLIYRAPVINIERNPYWGRNYEAWGEDPFLTGRMGVAYVKGLQGDDPRHLKVASTLKHYAVNNVEIERMQLDAKVSERMLHEYWLPHFRDAVVEGKVASLMASYNAINGVPNNMNRWLLTDLLKKQWGHQGFVVSDLGGVKTMVEGHGKKQMTYIDAVAQSVMAGCDFSDREYEQHIPAAVRAGKLTEERLNDALSRVLKVRFQLGEFDPLDASPYGRISRDVVNSAANHAVARKAAEQSIVLLQNRGDLLPLDATKLKKVAVIGPFADLAITNGYNGRHENIVTALRGIREAFGKEIEIVSAQGARGVTNPALQNDWGKASGGRSLKMLSESKGEFIEFPVQAPAEGAYELTLHFKGHPAHGVFQASVDGKAIGAPIDMYSAENHPGMQAGLGNVTLPKGRHLIRFTVEGRNPASHGYGGSFDKLTLSGAANGGVEIEKAGAVSGLGSGETFLAEGVAAAKDADAVILCLGSDTRNEMEDVDRTFLGLPGNQQALAEAVIAANPRTAVVLFGAGPLTVPWLKEHAPAMLQAWWPGQEGGAALADVLLGKVNPAGRLPHTVYASEKQVPSIDEYDVTKGFTYLYLNAAPLYAFGHGLSYTTFQYSKLRLSAESIASDGTFTVTVDVKNTGKRSGDEVAQLYVHEVKPVVKRPAKELRGFQRVSLAPGEERTLTFTVPASKLAYWDETKHAFVVNPGAFDILVGASSADIRLKEQIEVSR
ncbi:MAG TPA: glycoside hydrolase family 3 C-terminal domain-containing protein [Luteolibacter sp.]